MTTWTRWATDELEAIRDSGRWRQPQAFDADGPAGTLDGRPVVSFASNDYLGLSSHPDVKAAATQAIARWGTGSGASRLIVGSRPCHHELEAELAAWKGTARAVVFPTGFTANLGTLSVVGGPDVTVFSDELNHASIIDGCRLSRSRVAVYRHGDVDHLASLVAGHPGRRVVVTDTVFSMDGDEAPLDALGELCAYHGALLVLDEAHAVLGPEAPALDGLEVLRIGTLSKALGALGGFVAGPAPLIDLLVNRSRPFIFTTASSPADTAAALAALDLVRGPAGDLLRARLRGAVDRVRPAHPSPIVPIVLGDEAVTLKASARLLDEGVLVPAIRPPTVPPGTSRLRVALSAAHTDAMLDQLLAALAALDVHAAT
jgi:8-amino-7-oxononanoate synthase